jgi:hypothetical protein
MCKRRQARDGDNRGETMKALAKRLALFLLLAPLTAHGDMPGKHPFFLHALTDLRHARAHLEKPNNPQVNWDERTAIHAVDEAIGEIKKAAIDDGKPLSDHPPVDIGLDHPGRLHRALELLRKARQDIEQHESNDFARGLRARAVGHIDRAINFTEQGIANARH